MNGLPLHPAIVHLPLALAMLLPLGAIVIVWLAWRRKTTSSPGIARGPLAALIVAQALLVGGGLAARAAGESDEDRVEAIVPEAAIETHESQSEQFVWAGAVVLGGFMAAWAFARRPRIARPLVTVAAAGTVAVLVLGLAVGHSGGELVYRHGAANAHLGQAASSSAPALSAPLSRKHDADDD